MTAAEAEVDDYRVTEFGANIMCLFGTMFLFHSGYISFSADVPPAIWATLVIFPWAAGLVLLGVAVSPIDPRPWGTHLAFIVVIGVLTGDVAITYSKVPGLYEFGTDTLLFSRHAVDLLVQGVNPYEASMTPVPYPVEAQMTPTLDGGHVTSFSYPAGSILAFLPQRLTGLGRVPLHMTPLLAAVAVLSYLIAVSPREIAIAPAIIFGGMGLFTDATGGIIDALWAFPLLLAMFALYTDDWLKTGLWFGVAASMKQQPWLIAPFLLIWALKTDADRWRNAARLVGSSVATFLLINLPFIVWNPQEWLKGVFTPVANPEGADLIPQGVGIVAVRVSEWVMLPKTVFTVLVALAAISTLVAYSFASPRWRWVAFLMPPVILFLHWRSLPSYFVWYLPVVYMALLAAADALEAEDMPELSELVEADHA